MLFFYCFVNQSLYPHFSPLTQKKKKAGTSPLPPTGQTATHPVDSVLCKPGTPHQAFPKSFGFIECIPLMKSTQKVFVAVGQSVQGNWLNVLSITLKPGGFFLLVWARRCSATSAAGTSILNI